MWYKKADDADFKHIDPEEDWEEAEQADQVFKQNDIRYGRDKNISQVAIENGVVIGALASGWDKDNSYGEDVMVFSFDLVVKPEFRRQGVGLKLIQQGLAKYKQEKGDYQEMGNQTMMRIWVINPVLIPVLEGLGFQAESEPYENGSVHLIAY